MPHYVLHYFDCQFLAEAPRMIFKLAGVEFEDRRIKVDDWPQWKDKFLLKQIPVLEVDGVSISQSKAILRYLSREFGFYGSTPLEGAFIDEVIDTTDEAWMPIKGIYLSEGEERKRLTKRLKEEHLPHVYRKLEKLLSLDRAGDFYVGNSITPADLFVVITTESLDEYLECNTLEKFPKLEALKSRVVANPIIARWIAERPPPEMVYHLRTMPPRKNVDEVPSYK